MEALWEVIVTVLETLRSSQRVLSPKFLGVKLSGESRIVPPPLLIEFKLLVLVPSFEIISESQAFMSFSVFFFLVFLVFPDTSIV